MTLLTALTTKDGETRRVLAVDDDAFTRASVSRFLTAEGIAHEICSHPNEAIALCKAHPGRYALVLMDIRFPQGNLGLEATRKILEGPTQDAPVVIGMTSHASMFEREDWSKSGMTDVIVKPLFKWLVVNLARQHGAC